MVVSQAGLDLIKKFEGLRLKAYLDQVGIPTIGYGATFYPDGKKVEMGEHISLETANKLLAYHVNMFAKKVDELVTTCLTQNEFDSLVSFAYNVGVGALQKSTLLKYVNENPNNPNIRTQFMRWNRGGGKVLPGLTQRRKLEADLYFKP